MEYYFYNCCENRQQRFCGKFALWTAAKKGSIIGFTKEVTANGGPLKTGITCTVLIIASGMDLTAYKIKNGLIYAALAVGILLYLPLISVNSSLDLLAGIFLPAVICWIPFLMHALGAGDIKLFSVIGCINGGRDAVYCIGFSFVIAAGFSLGRLLRRKQLWTSLIKCFQYFQDIISKGRMMPYPAGDEEGHKIHFSPFILLGYLIYLGVKDCSVMQWF